MTITAGNPKCFELSKSLWKDGATVSVTSGESSKNNLIDFNKLTRWQSSGSDDTTTETIIITFPEVSTISSLLILDHNWKSYDIHPVTSAYILDHLGLEIVDHLSDEIEDDGGELSFRNVISSYNATPQVDITETSYSYEDAYYEFDSMYCSGIKIDVTIAQELHDVPDQEKFAYRVIPTIEVNDKNGTFEGYPDLQRITDYFGTRSRMISGKHRVQKLDPTLTCGLFLRSSPSQNDITLIEFLRTNPNDFLFYPCGGAPVENENFRFSSVPYNLYDIFQMQVSGSFSTSYINNIVSNPVDMSLALVETIG